MKNNLEHSALPSPDELKLYQEGKLAPMRSHEIELLAQENPLLAEAIEGFAAKPAYNMLPLIHAGIAQASGAAAGGGTIGGLAGAAKVSTPWWHLNGWVVGVITGTATAVTVTVAINSTSNKDVATNTNNTNQSIEQSTVDASVTEQMPVITDMNHSAQSTVAQEPVNNTSANQNVITTDEPEQIETDFQRPESAGGFISSIDQNEVNSLSQTQTTPADEAPKRSSTVAIGIIKVMNYKLADYTALREPNWQKFSLEDVGVPAEFANSEQRAKFLKENPDQSMAYVDYVTQCIKAYDENKFTLALSRFAVILEQYGDDVNALFYSGMSHYVSGNYAVAVDFFEKVEKNYIRTFNEEALFYHAKSMKKLGKIDEANSLFVKVVKWNGFYKEQAVKELESED